MTKRFSVTYWPALVIIAGSALPAAVFYELERSVPCLCAIVVHSLGIVAVILRQFCPVPGFEVPLSACLWGSFKAFEVLLQIGEAVRPLACAAIIYGYGSII
jgi:hypothetical protein